MHLKITKTTHLHGQATPPSSKSQTIRGLFIATMADGQSVLRNALVSEDATAAIGVCVGLGAKVSRQGQDFLVESTGVPLEGKVNQLDSGDSGITTRFALPMIGLRQKYDQKIILDCGEQMRQRPILPLIEALNELGMKVESINNNDACPLKLSDPLRGGKVKIDGLTSQYLSALLLSLPCALGDSEIKVEDLCERPYVDMTLAWLDEQGIKYEHEYRDGVDIYRIKGGQRYHSFDKIIPGDFSSASYLIAAGVLLNGRIELSGLDMGDYQGDKRLAEILQSMGADIRIDGLKMIINGGKKLIGKRIDCNDIPDLVPTLAVIGTQADGKTELVNVSQARIKETDRLKSMSDGLDHLGARIEEKSDGLTVYQSQLNGASIRGYNDHRTVMALSVAGLLAEGRTVVDTAESINKTFPDFVKIMNSLGANIEIVY